MREPAPRYAFALVAALLLLAASPAHATFPGANGTLVAAHCDDGTACNAPRVRTQGTPGAQLFADPAGVYDDDPSFSADGLTVAARRCQVTGSVVNCGIATVVIDGQGQKQLTPMDGSVDDDDPVFSPDGGTIAFTRGSEIWAMNRDGGQQRPLTSGPDDFEPDFAPDGRTIAFARGDEIWLMNPNGGDQRLLVSDSDASDSKPSFSPNGSQIAFQSCPTGGGPCEVNLMGIDGTGRHTLISRYLNDFDPVFTPDGTRITYASEPIDAPVITTSSLADPSAKPTFNGIDGPAYRPAWGRVPNPVLDSVPAIQGEARVGHPQVLVLPPLRFAAIPSFQWMRCNRAGGACKSVGENPLGPHSAIYSPVNADVGHRIQVGVVVRNAAGSASATSPLGPVVVAEPKAKLASKAVVSHGLARIRVSAPADEFCGNLPDCTVSATLSANLAGRSARRRHKPVPVGKRTIEIQNGKSRLMRIRISRRSLVRLRRTGRLPVRAAVVITDAIGNRTKSQRSLALVPARKRSG